MKYLSAQDVIQLHEVVILPNELQGLAANKAVEAIIARINNRICYGMISDVFELAACYASYIAVGHAFNDANKRTAYLAMMTCLSINGIKMKPDDIGDIIIQVAQSKMDETELANWLREKS